MLHRYVNLYQRLSLPRCHVRLVSTEVHSSGIQRKRGRPKADEDVSKKRAVTRKRRALPDDIKDDATGVGKDVFQAGANGSSKDTPSSRREDSKSPGVALSTNAVEMKKAYTKMSIALRATPRLLARRPKHNDLPSYYKHAKNAKLDPNGSVYKGTEYEYKTVDTLKAFNFELVRIGAANDGGVDLIGYWFLPDTDKLPNPLRVIVQCKAYESTPRMARELESSTGAPAGWRGENVFRLLVANGKSTKGVIETMQRSSFPMGYIWMTPQQEVKQIWWNAAAARASLEEISATVKYSNEDGNNKLVKEGEGPAIVTTVALTWKGRTWRPVEPKAKIKDCPNEAKEEA